MRRWALWATVGVVTTVAIVAVASASESGVGPVSSAGRSTFDRLLDAGPFDRKWRALLTAVASRESKWHSGAVRETTRERSAAKIAYDRNAEFGRFDGCPWPEQRYTWGSGGYFGLLPANAVANVRKAFPCADPMDVTDPVMSFVFAVAFANALMRRDSFAENPTVGNLGVGWGNPSGMGSVLQERKAATFDKHLRRSGFPVSVAQESIRPLDVSYRDLSATLEAAR